MRCSSGDKGVSTVDRQRWGKEGEITLCIDTLTGGDADRLFGAIKAVFPASSQKPISVETAAGQRYRRPDALTPPAMAGDNPAGPWT